MPRPNKFGSRGCRNLRRKALIRARSKKLDLDALLKEMTEAKIQKKTNGKPTLKLEVAQALIEPEHFHQVQWDLDKELLGDCVELPPYWLYDENLSKKTNVLLCDYYDAIDVQHDTKLYQKRGKDPKCSDLPLNKESLVDWILKLYYKPIQRPQETQEQKELRMRFTFNKTFPLRRSDRLRKLGLSRPNPWEAKLSHYNNQLQ